MESEIPLKKWNRSARVYSRENSRLAIIGPSAPVRLAWTSPPKRTRYLL